jgi:glycyl-tRNA synthetase
MNIDEILAFAKSRGMFWQSAEIYGSAAGLYDYGHIGTLIKRRFEDVWISYFVDTNDSYHLIEGSNMLPERPLVASGHAARFNDIIIGCSKCGTYYRADVLLADLGVTVSEGATPEELDKAVEQNAIKCPKCKGALLKSKPFNMMLDLYLGPEKSDKGYLRPETAQSSYLNFYREFNILRKTLPFGLAIIGRAYRNEISPRQGLYRMRELTQAELQIFFDPQTWKVDMDKVKDRKINVVTYSRKTMENKTIAELVRDDGIPDFYAFHLAMIDAFYRDVIGVPADRLRFLEKGGDEKAFYNKVHMDIEVNVESWGGFREVGGLHYRGDYDLTSHSKGSMQDLSVNVGDRKVMPNVLELSFGVDRNIWMLIDVFYRKDGDRSVLSLAPYLAPYKAAVFPLQKDEKIMGEAKSLFSELRQRFRMCTDESGSIGRRYARVDEIGVPFGITVDFDTVTESSPNYKTVTVRYRDDKRQARVHIDELAQFIDSNTRFNPFKAFGGFA